MAGQPVAKIARTAQASAWVLTTAGEALRPVVMGLGEWGAKYQFGVPRESELDPELLM